MPIWHQYWLGVKYGIISIHWSHDTLAVMICINANVKSRRDLALDT